MRFGLGMLAAVALALGALAVPAPPAQADLPTVVLLLFLDAESEAAGLPADPAVLRAGAERQLIAALATPGRRVCAGPAVDGLLAAARVRSSHSLTRELLAALGAHCGAEQLCVARLAFCQGKLFLSLRGLDPADGRLTQVAVAERELQRGEDWQARLGDAVLEVAAAWREPAPAPAAATGLLVLPAVGAGVDPLLLSLMDDVLLAELLGHGCWRLIEPALLLSDLRAQGLHPAGFGAAPRRALAAGARAEGLLRLSVLADAEEPLGGPGRGSAAAALLMDDEDEQRGLGGGAAARQAGRSLYASLAWAEIDSGRLHGTLEQNLPAAATTGIFGRRVLPRWTERCRALIAPLAASLFERSAAVSTATPPAP